MPKVLLDACVPHRLRNALSDMDVETAKHAGLDGLSDSALLDAIDGRFDILVTLDRNLLHQQRIAGRRIAIIVLRVFEQSPEAFLSLLPTLKLAISEVSPGTVVTVEN